MTYTPDIGPRPQKPHGSPSSLPWTDGVLVRATNWLGDALMTLPAVYRLSRLLPEGACFAVLCPAGLEPLWRSTPWVTEVIGFTGRRLDSKCKEKVARLNHGVTVVLPNSFGSAWDLWRAGSPRRIGRGGRFRGRLLNNAIPAWHRDPGQDRYHQAREYLEIAIACGSEEWGLDYPPLEPGLDHDARAAVEPVLSGTQGQLLVIAPGAAYGPAKQWPAARFRDVASWWLGRGGRVIVVGGDADAEAAAATVNGVRAGIVNLAGKTSLAQLIYLLHKADCVLSNDSGSMHLAAALGKPGVAVFGSTDPLATGPVGGRWIVVQNPISCSPCLARECFRRDAPYECMETIAPETVQEGLDRVMEGDNQ